MRMVLNTIPMDGVVVIGEGAKDKAPMLFEGEHLGCADEPKTDIAVDPIDGTRLLSQGMANSISTVAVSERGSMFESPYVCVHGQDRRRSRSGRRDRHQCLGSDTNLDNVARALSRDVRDLAVVMLDRPRHEQLAQQVREAGARIRFIMDGDVAGAVMAATPGTGIDVLMGIGGAPEAVVAACAIRCMGGEMQCKLWPRERGRMGGGARMASTSRVLSAADLVRGDDVFFAATGITDGELLRGVHYFGGGATTESVVMRSRFGTTRRIVRGPPAQQARCLWCSVGLEGDEAGPRTAYGVAVARSGANSTACRGIC